MSDVKNLWTHGVELTGADGQLHTYADPHDDWWEVDDLVVYLGLGRIADDELEVDWPVGRRVVYGYHYKANLRRRAQEPQRGDLPEAVYPRGGRTPKWRPERIMHWQEHERPGQGAGGGRYARKGEGRWADPSLWSPDDDGEPDPVVEAQEGALALGRR